MMTMSATDWSKGEKTIARRAFERAYERECTDLANEVRQMVGQIDSPNDIWKIHDFLTDKRKDIDEKYDYRYSVLIFVFTRLIGEGWVEEEQLNLQESKNKEAKKRSERSD